jgi:branched-chain amino acid transport system permease protein
MKELSHTPSQARLGSYLRTQAPFLALVVIALTIPLYVSDTYYLSILAFMATRFMVIIGLSLLVGQAGQISLGQAAFVGIGAYGAAILTTGARVDPWLAMFLAALIAGAIAALIGIPTLRLTGYYLAMATLGVNEIVSIVLAQLKYGTFGIGGIPSLSVGGLDLGTPRLYHLVVWAFALLMFRVALNIAHSRVGRSLRGMRQSEVAAEALGVETSYRKVQVFVIAAVFASVAGSFDAYYVGHIWPADYGIFESIILITGVIIGGLRSVWGALWGAIVIAILPELLKRIGLEDWQHLTYGVLLILIMVLSRGRTHGISQMIRAWRKRRETAAGSASVGK